jgi:hypothetical protein
MVQRHAKTQIVPDNTTRAMWKREKVQLLVEWISEDYTEGDVIFRKDIMKRLDLVDDDYQWSVVAQPLVRRADTVLQQQLKYHLKAVHGRGYRILKSEEIMDNCERKMFLGAKKIHRAVDSSKRIDMNRIPPEARREHEERQTRMAFIFQGIENSGLKLLPE